MPLIIILITLLFANEEIIKKEKKVTKNEIISKEILIRNFFVNSYNALVPSFLETEPTENMAKFTFGYDLKNKKTYSKANIKILLPSIEKELKKTNKITLKTQEITFKILPFLQIYDSKPTLTIKPSFTYKVQDFTFNESIYYYLVANEYKEISTISFKKKLLYKFSKTYKSTQKSNLFYDFGIYYYTKQKKDITTYGLIFGGERKKLPIIYYYKLFFTFRYLIKKYLYFDFTPYFYYSKEYHYTPKFFANISLNFKF